MRDAFGGAFLIKIFLVFILIYICFTALALNYAKAFKVKDALIDYLENSEIYNLDEGLNAEKLNSLNTFIELEILGNMNYNVSELNICSHIRTKDDNNRTIAICHDSGVVIRQEEINSTEKNTEGTYYTVTTYVGWMAPFLNALLKLNGNNEEQDDLTGVWQISGQTRLIVNKVIQR